jgi:hypothetical protein
MEIFTRDNGDAKSWPRKAGHMCIWGIYLDSTGIIYTDYIAYNFRQGKIFPERFWGLPNPSIQ